MIMLLFIEQPAGLAALVAYSVASIAQKVFLLIRTIFPLCANTLLPINRPRPKRIFFIVCFFKRFLKKFDTFSSAKV